MHIRGNYYFMRKYDPCLGQKTLSDDLLPIQYNRFESLDAWGSTGLDDVDTYQNYSAHLACYDDTSSMFRSWILIDGLRKMRSRAHRREGLYKITTESDQNALDLRTSISTYAVCIPAMSVGLSVNAPPSKGRQRMRYHTSHRTGHDDDGSTGDSRRC
jgi:hypothetical protein